MNERRIFLKGSAAALTTLALTTAAGSALAGGGNMTNIIYTSANPGKWGKKVGSHLPSITVNGGKVTVTTKHGMSAKHYIVRHTLVLEDGSVHGARTFSPTSAEAKSSFDLPAGYKGKLTATSYCNLHDLWVNETTV
ncbi:MAG: desulfoferrodoxin family protein [Thermodesulfobacteriota bacterium]